MPRNILSRAALVLILGLMAARMMISDSPRGGETIPGPSSGTPATGIALDLLCCVPALLVLVRRVMDRTYALGWTYSLIAMLALVLWTAASIFWAADKFAAALGTSHFAAAAALLWASSQVVQSWLRLRAVAAVALGLLAALAMYAAYERFVNQPMYVQDFEQHQAQILAERGWAPDSPQARLLESNIRRGTLVGFYHSANTFAAVAAMLFLVAVGWLAELRAVHDNRAAVWIATSAVLALGLLLLALTTSKAAAGTVTLGLLMLGAMWRWRTQLARHASAAFVAGCLAMVLLGLEVAGMGLYTGHLPGSSLTFRWWYWVGAVRVWLHHPLAGVGWDNFGLHYLVYRLPIASEEPTDPHNYLIKLLVELGIVGGLLGVTWLGMLWWDLTRPLLPREGKPPSRRPQALVQLGAVAAIATLLSLACGIDWSQDGHYVFMIVLERLVMLGALFGTALVVVTAPDQSGQIDHRPAPWLLYAMLTGSGMFLVHSLVDFSMSEAGPLCLWATLVGSALGIRLAPRQWRRRPTALATAGAVAVAVVIVSEASCFWIPTAGAEAMTGQAEQAIVAGNRPLGLNLLINAAQTQPLDADYYARAAAHAPPDQAEVLFTDAIAANPMAGHYYRSRAEALLAGRSATHERIEADFGKAVELNPCGIDVPLEYANALASFPEAPARVQAVAQYEKVLWLDAQMEPHDIRQLPPDTIGKIRSNIAQLR